MGAHKPLVLECPSSIKYWKEGWFWVPGNWQRVVNDPEPDLNVSSFYGVATSFERGERPTPPLARVMTAKVRQLRSGSSNDIRQNKTIQEISKEATLEEAQNVASNLVDEELSSGEEEPLAKKKRTGGLARARPTFRMIMQGTKPVEDTIGKGKLVEVVETIIVLPPFPKHCYLAMMPAGVNLDDAPTGVGEKRREVVGQTLLEWIKECFHSTVALAESTKLAYEKDRLEIVEAKSQVAILAKTLEDPLNAQKIALEVLETANGKNHRLRDEVAR
ncbi:hypothetical protein Adt_11759 [Abeliophyllum distichum]|uniref:Uncharacterized protein n=1 Tax=Abeliophyllum distichum TaxID=126358 RepID=A0ABD1UNY4_9LAMI